MFDFFNANLEQLIVHKIGNKLREEGIIFSEKPQDIQDENMKEILLKYFLSSFNFEKVYRFHHESDLNLNEIYTYLSRVFRMENELFEESSNIARFLYSKSYHPRIKSGELYISYISNCIINGKSTDCIGIFKSENRDHFLKVNSEENNLSIYVDQGIDMKRLEKGCIVFNVDEKQGYKVLVIDNTKSNSEEAKYWKVDFLNVTSEKNNTYYTEKYIKICNNFYDKAYESGDYEKQEIIEKKNQTLNYFSSNDHFDIDDYSSRIIKSEKYINEFNKIIKSSEEIPMSKFNIEPNVVKKEIKKFKNIIKLDNNFELTIKTNNKDGELEKGFDEEKQMFFYKIYYKREF
ncbi:hypothetical protein ACFSCX_20505 [Bacillus salitolerans]|uniref:Nucleoid-associated protein n=1 Tax=Bacillus salitolerans TaxID=1437434 RepID=A0ABW4LUQ9_9BACI